MRTKELTWTSSPWFLGVLPSPRSTSALPVGPDDIVGGHPTRSTTRLRLIDTASVYVNERPSAAACARLQGPRGRFAFPQLKAPGPRSSNAPPPSTRDPRAPGHGLHIDPDDLPARGDTVAGYRILEKAHKEGKIRAIDYTPVDSYLLLLLMSLSLSLSLSFTN